MKKKIISAGHICIDITPVFPRDTQCARIGDLLVPGRLIHMKGADVHTGGSVANTGLALKMLGADVQLLGKVGDDAFGAMIRDLLAGYGAEGLIVDKDSSTSYSVVLAIPGIDRVRCKQWPVPPQLTHEILRVFVTGFGQRFHFRDSFAALVHGQSVIPDYIP